MVKFAFDLRDYQISGASGWMDGDRYRIEVTYPTGASTADRAKMMQAMSNLVSLLADLLDRPVEGRQPSAVSTTSKWNGNPIPRSDRHADSQRTAHLPHPINPAPQSSPRFRKRSA